MAQGHANNFPLLSVFMLRQANHVLIPAPYLTHRHECGIDHLISVLERANTLTSQMLNFYILYGNMVCMVVCIYSDFNNHLKIWHINGNVYMNNQCQTSKAELATIVLFLKITVDLGSLLDYFLECWGKHKYICLPELIGTVALASQNNNLCGNGVHFESYSAYTTWWDCTCCIFQITTYQLSSRKLFAWKLLFLGHKSVSCWAASCDSQMHKLWLNWLNWSF